MSQGVKRGVRDVPGVKGGVQVSQGVRRGVRGVLGVKGRQGVPRWL